MMRTYSFFQLTKRGLRSCSGRKQSRDWFHPKYRKITSVLPFTYHFWCQQLNDELIIHIEENVLLSEHVSVFAHRRNFSLLQNLDCDFFPCLSVKAQ